MISEPNRIFQTKTNQTHSKLNRSFSKIESKQIFNKKSMPHIGNIYNEDY